MVSLKTRLHDLLNETADTKAAQHLNSFLGALIIANLLALVLETVKSLHQQYEAWFIGFERISIVIFVIEYLARLWVSDIDAPAGKRARARLHWMISPMPVIDFIAILPGLLPLVHLDLRFLRSIRLFRLARILKLARYNHALQNLFHVVREKRHELTVAASLGLLLLTCSASLMYYCENEAQPDKFASIPDAMWWSVATLTTVGYGDVYPITTLGKFFGALTAFLGVGMFALPAAILASGFSETLARKKQVQKKCPHCGHVLTEEDLAST